MKKSLFVILSAVLLTAVICFSAFAETDEALPGVREGRIP